MAERSGRARSAPRARRARPPPYNRFPATTVPPSGIPSRCGFPTTPKEKKKERENRDHSLLTPLPPRLPPRARRPRAPALQRTGRGGDIRGITPRIPHDDLGRLLVGGLGRARCVGGGGGAPGGRSGGSSAALTLHSRPSTRLLRGGRCRTDLGGWLQSGMTRHSEHVRMRSVAICHSFCLVMVLYVVSGHVRFSAFLLLDNSLHKIHPFFPSTRSCGGWHQINV